MGRNVGICLQTCVLGSGISSEILTFGWQFLVKDVGGHCSRACFIRMNFTRALVFMTSFECFDRQNIKKGQFSLLQTPISLKRGRWPPFFFFLKSSYYEDLQYMSKWKKWHYMVKNDSSFSKKNTPSGDRISLILTATRGFKPILFLHRSRCYVIIWFLWLHESKYSTSENVSWNRNLVSFFLPALIPYENP